MPNPRTWTLPADLEAAVSATLREWSEQGKVERLWARDATLWTGADEASWLGWLGIVDEQVGRVGELRRIAEDVRQAGFTHVLLLGMGGSSLCPEVLRMTFGTLPGWPELSVLDSTDPAQVRACEARVDLGRTLFVVSSKSGTTLEPNIFKQHFFERVKQAIGPGQAGDRFIAITDPGSKLEQVARADGFRHVLLRAPVDRRALLGALRLRHGPRGPHGARRRAAARRGAGDGARLRGPGARRGESRSGARGHPGRAREPGTRQGHAGRLSGDPRSRRLARAAPGRVDREGGQGPDPGRSRAARPAGALRPGPPVRLPPARTRRRTPPRTARWRASRRPGSPWSGSRSPSRDQIAAEFFRWEFATAVAGAILGINPFDQPDVEASKVATRRLTDAFEKTGRLPAETPILETEGIRLFADPRNAARAGGGRPDARGRPARPPRADPARRLRGAPRLRRDDGGARGGAPGDPHAPPRPVPRRHLPRLRAAVPPLDGPGLQGRAQHRRVPPDHVPTTPWTCPCPASATRSAS